MLYVTSAADGEACLYPPQVTPSLGKAAATKSPWLQMHKTQSDEMSCSDTATVFIFKLQLFK